MKNLVPYLMFNGTCEEALNFYKDGLNGELGYVGRYGDAPLDIPEDQKNKIMHAEFKFWGGAFLASDALEEADYTTAAQGSNVHLSLGFEDRAEMDDVFNKLKQGGRVTMELQEQFWGDYFGMLTDRFGIHWMFNCPGEQTKHK